MSTKQQRATRTRRALISTGAAVASCAALACVGTGVAAASHKPLVRKPAATKKVKPKVTVVPWGTYNGQTVNLYTLHGAGGMKVNISTFGADVQSIYVPSKSGKLTNVALGFSSLADYVADFTQGATQTPFPAPSGTGDTYFGATVGRYANRIAKGTFPLNGQTYTLDLNNGANSLHGGYTGWSNDVWSGTSSTTGSVARVAMSASFPAGEGCDLALSPGCTGYPAPMTATVTFSLNAANQLKIGYSATNTSPSLSTVVNLTNHTYFNLGGQASGTVYDQDLALNSNEYTPIDSTSIPEAPYFVNVKGTAFDFRTMHPIGELINATNLPDGTSGTLKQLQFAHGYDHNWVLNGTGYRKVAVAQDPSNGITLTTYTDQPGVQMYTGNFLVGDLIGTTGKAYRQGDGFTLETQHYPDSPNHIGDPAWPSVVLGAGQTFTSQTAFKFGIEPANYSKSVSFK